MKVYVNYSENIHFTAKARQFDNFHIDEPKSFHGTDLGPSPVEYILIGIAGCLGSTLAFCLQKKKIEIEELEVILDGKLNHSDDPLLKLMIAKVDVELILSIKGNPSPEDIELCIKTFQNYCVVSNSILNGFPIEAKVIKKEK